MREPCGSKPAKTPWKAAATCANRRAGNNIPGRFGGCGRYSGADELTEWLDGVRVSMRPLAAVEALTPRAGHPGLIPYRDGRLVHQTVGSEYQEAVE